MARHLAMNSTPSGDEWHVFTGLSKQEDFRFSSFLLSFLLLGDTNVIMMS